LPLRRLLLTLEYDGTDFFGWQIQAAGRTVQGLLEEAVRRLTQEAVRVTGASRTDSGVHAEGQAAHFDTHSPLAAPRFVPALNFYLPPDVSVLSCHEVDASFHARYGAASKLYRYRILRSGPRRPLRERFVLREWRPLDLDSMSRCAALLFGEHDFSSFASEHSEDESHVRRLTRSELVEASDELHYLVEANGFLYNMVRAIVGTLLGVGHGRMTPEQFEQVLCARQRSLAGPTAPARGLTLVRVSYPDDPRGIADCGLRTAD
jgi:tRNA pseudouridine38-40 synthase